MRDILQSKSPYKILQESEGLIEKVDALNGAILIKARKEAQGRIDQAYQQVATELDRIGGDDGLKRSCLSNLDGLREQVEKQQSVAHIGQAIGLAGGAVDAALAKIEDYLKAKAREKGKEPLPPPKPRKDIRPADLVKTPCLETEDDINTFLDALRTELKASLDRGERIHIR